MDTDFRIETVRTHALAECTRDAVVQLCTAAHGHDFSPLFTLLPPDGLHVMAYVHNRLVSHAVTTTRWLQPERLPLLRTAYVDAVATALAMQGQGYASAVMRHLATTVMDYDIACLETGRVSFYTRLGWEPWRGPLGGRTPDGLIPTPDQTGILILRLPRTPPLDLDGLLTIECQTVRIW